MKKIRKIMRKGEISTTWIVTIILLIAGFAILLYFLVGFLWNSRIDKETCHQSVVFRATLPSIAENYIPLKCKTAKYCITTGSGGSCDKQGEAFAGEKEISKIKVSNVEQIDKFIAGEIIDCWTMMGEGKISLFTQYMAKNFGFGGIASSCVICNRIAFDSSLEKANINLKDINLMAYMTTHKAPDKQVSYLAYITGQNGKLNIKTDSDIQAIADPLSKVAISEEDGKEVIGYGQEKLNDLQLETATTPNYPKQFSVMFMQIVAPKESEVLKNTAYAIFGGLGVSTVFAPISTAKFAIGAVKSAAFWEVALPIAALVGLSQYVNVVLNRDLAAGYCGDVSVGSEAKDGCSVVRTINYDVDELSQYCSVIESIP